MAVDSSTKFYTNCLSGHEIATEINEWLDLHYGNVGDPSIAIETILDVLTPETCQTWVDIPIMALEEDTDDVSQFEMDEKMSIISGVWDLIKSVDLSDVDKELKCRMKELGTKERPTKRPSGDDSGLGESTVRLIN